jgi:MFS family permease
MSLRQLRASLGSLARVFENPDLARLIVGWTGTMFATWTFAIALGVYAFTKGGPTAVGVAALVRVLPGALSSPFAGMLGDRRSRRLVLVASSVASGAAIALAAIAATTDAPAWTVYAIAGLFTVASTPYVPAEGALLPLLARSPQELSATNVARSQGDNIGFLLASLAAGALLAFATPQAAFAVAALIAVLVGVLLATLPPDVRPVYEDHSDAAGVVREAAAGLRALLADRRLRTVSVALIILVFIEGAADVMSVVIVLHLLGIGEGNVGWINASWAVGALVAGVGLAVLLDRGRLAAGLAAGSLVVGGGLALPGIWPVVAVAFTSYFLLGFGYAFVEVAARTLLQRLGSDETLARAIGFLETSRLTAVALGSIAAPALVALLGVRGALLALGSLLPLFALLRWRELRELEIGAPVSERDFNLLRGSSIFAPLPVDTIEGLCRAVVDVDASSGDELITQGARGDLFYVIASGEVEVIEDGAFKRTMGAGGAFGEIALLQDVPRTATVRATGASRLIALDGISFIQAVTGHRRSHLSAREVAAGWLKGSEPRRGDGSGG